MVTTFTDAHVLNVKTNRSVASLKCMPYSSMRTGSLQDGPFEILPNGLVNSSQILIGNPKELLSGIDQWKSSHMPIDGSPGARRAVFARGLSILRHQTTELEGAPSFALFAKGGILRSCGTALMAPAYGCPTRRYRVVGSSVALPSAFFRRGAALFTLSSEGLAPPTSISNHLSPINLNDFADIPPTFGDDIWARSEHAAPFAAFYSKRRAATF